MRIAAVCLAAICVIAIGRGPAIHAQSSGPRAALTQTTRHALAGEVDSNSPVLWDRVFGRWTLFVMTSIDGAPSLSSGRSLTMLQAANRVMFRDQAMAGVWMESVLADDSGTWYGFYHQERGYGGCGPVKMVPRIGAARSRNRGRTWVDLGPVLEVPRAAVACTSNNHYFLGGAGDFTVLLDRDSQFLYFYYTQYAEHEPNGVGVSLARMAWADRDAPAGTITVWNDGAWLAASFNDVDAMWEYPIATPLMPARDPWDNGSRAVDVLWGPALHWNTHLNQYVMLLNRAVSNEWEQEGIYVSYNDNLDDARGWSAPVRLLSGGRWYPQVIGLGTTGTDKEAGETARFYMSGVSDYLIRFSR